MTQRYSYSALQTFKSCPLAYFYKYEVGLRLREEGANQHHLVYGKAMHAALEFLYQSNYTEALLNHSKNQCTGCELEVVLLTAQEIFKVQYPTQLNLDDLAKTQANGLRVLELYVHKWAEEDARWRVLDCELLDCELLDPEDNQENYYSRRLDLVVEDLQYGGIYGVDHKIVGGERTKYLRGDYWTKFEPDSQITQYCDWIAQRYGRCDGFFINAIGMNWLAEKDSKGGFNGKYFDPDLEAKPWLEYSENECRYVKYHKREMIAAWGLQVQFRREMFNRNQAQIEQEQKSRDYWINRIDEARQFNWWGFNTASCTFCEYRGNAQTPGPCMAGWTWPQDEALILLNYRRECRQIIMLECPACKGDGLNQEWLKQLQDRISSEHRTLRWNQMTLELEPCPRCNRRGEIQGPRCVLDLGHEGTCSSEMPQVDSDVSFTVEVPA